jgi:acyl-CoA synthetase (AMP-forming)/AMP-acid ligase II
MLTRIVDALDARGGEPLLGVRALSYGGGKMPRPVIERALELFPITNFVNAYGLTETSSTIALLGPDDHRVAQYSDDPIEKQRLASVGRPLPGIEVQIRDDAGEALPAGEVGEIYVRGEQVAGEYREKGSLLDADGWFPTRDGGYLDADGYLFIQGRNDDVIIRGGENMSPGEIEDVAISHPNVRNAAAIGVPCREWGEKVVLVVVPDGGPPDADEVGELIRSRLRSSRVPAHIVTVDALPYNETGKLLRRVLRDDHAHLGDDPTD